MQPRRRLSLGFALLLLVAVAAAWLFVQSEPVTQRLLWNSVRLSLAACAISLPLGTALAVFLVRTDCPGRRAALVILALLLFMPLYLQAAGWDAGFGRQGWYSYAVTSVAAPVLRGWRAAIWIHALAAIPWTVAIVGAGLRFVERELEEQALLDGSPLQVFWHVTLRRAFRSLVIAALWTVVSVSGEITVTDMYQVSTYARELYQGFALGDDWTGVGRGILPGMTATLGLVLATLLVVVNIAGGDQLPLQRPPWQFSLGAWRWPVTICVWLAIGCLVGVPFGNLLYKAGLVVRQVGTDRERIWSAGKFVHIMTLAPWRFAREFGWTAVIGGVAASVTVVLAAPLAWCGRGGGRQAIPATLAVAVGFAVPGPLVGMALIWLLNRNSPWQLSWLYDQTIAAPVIAMTIRALPLAITTCWFGLRGVSREELDAATIDGAGAVTRFLCVVLPPRRSILGVAWLASFAVSAGDLAASILVLPPGVYTLGPRVFDLLHAGVDDQVAALCLVSSSGFVAIAAMAIAALARKRSS